MKITETKSVVGYVGRRTATLLEELREECQNISNLLVQLELPSLQDDQAEDLLGELSAAILHLHEHTRGLHERLLDKSK